jgi:hypothetical protein
MFVFKRFLHSENHNRTNDFKRAQTETIRQRTTHASGILVKSQDLTVPARRQRPNRENRAGRSDSREFGEKRQCHHQKQLEDSHLRRAAKR